jgi:hypothetical protein
MRESDNIITIEHNWVKTFVLFPHRTINKHWVWLKQVYVRRVWIDTGFHVEPETQYADLFDILKNNDYN